MTHIWPLASTCCPYCPMQPNATNTSVHNFGHYMMMLLLVLLVLRQHKSCQYAYRQPERACEKQRTKVLKLMRRNNRTKTTLDCGWKRGEATGSTQGIADSYRWLLKGCKLVDEAVVRVTSAVPHTVQHPQGGLFAVSATRFYLRCCRALRGHLHWNLRRDAGVTQTHTHTHIS